MTEDDAVVAILKLKKNPNDTVTLNIPNVPWFGGCSLFLEGITYSDLNPTTLILKCKAAGIAVQFTDIQEHEQPHYLP